MKLRIKFFACLLLLTTFGCTHEEEENVIVEDSNGVTLVRGNFSEFSNLKDLYNETVIRQKEASLHSKDDLYNFEIDSSSITKVTFANDEYFTFSIERKNNDQADRTFENLIISNKENNTPTAYLLKYSPDDDYLNRFAVDSDAYFSGERTIQPLEFEKLKTSRGGCFTVTTTYCNYDDHEENELGPGVAGPACTDTYTVTESFCIDIPDNGGSDDNGNNGGTGGGGGNALGDDAPLGQSDIITEPISRLKPASTLLIEKLDVTLNQFDASFLWYNQSISQKLLLIYNTNFFTDNEIATMIRLLRAGNTQQKAFLNAILNHDLESALTIFFQNVESNSYNPCPNPPCEGNFDATVVLSVQIINGFFDGAVNTIAYLGSPLRSSESRGRIVRELMEESGIIVNTDVDNNTLGNLFKLRSKGRELTFEPANQDFWDSLKDIGISLLDIVAIVSPSSGGGAFLFVKNGAGKITSASISTYFKKLKQGTWTTVNESMSDAAKSYQEFITGRSIRESFLLNGVKFDGLKNGILSDAKSGMLNFVNTNGTFKQFFLNSNTGANAILDQARRQRAAAGDLPIEWHFEHRLVRDAFENLLRNGGFNIKFIHTPR